MNRIISLGRDMHWRRELADKLDDNGLQPLLVLDIAAGTGDQMMLLNRRTGVRRVIGIDTSNPMLDIARRKLETAGNMAATSLIAGDSHRLPFTDGVFGAVTVSFGIRNFHDRPQTLRQIRRVLTPGGRLLILELTIPENRFILPLYLLYTRMVVPILGSLIAGDFSCVPLSQPLGGSLPAVPRVHRNDGWSRFP